MQPLVKTLQRHFFKALFFCLGLVRWPLAFQSAGIAAPSDLLPSLTITKKSVLWIRNYSGSRSSSEFSEFWIQIRAKVPDPCGSGSNPCCLSIFGNRKQNHLKFNYQLFAFFYFILQSYSTQSPEYKEK